MKPILNKSKTFVISTFQSDENKHTRLFYVQVVLLLKKLPETAPSALIGTCFPYIINEEMCVYMAFILHFPLPYK